MREALDSQVDGRTRRRLVAMRRVQAVALELFERDGWDAVSIEAIAAAAEVGPATIYRNFGSKERVVLWDEYDPMLLAVLTQELETHGVIDAMQRALQRALAEVYASDRDRILRRARLMRATPALLQVTAGDLRVLRGALAELLRSSKHARDELEAAVFAGALVTALEAAVDHWLDGDGEIPLNRCLHRAFTRLRRLGDA
ncbi:MAG: TetR family transcriptional regulator [Deltaproteobacteria bacterium]|nr:TetR family transcriptional regulator [Deltaproteobacteria bacterium]